MTRLAGLWRHTRLSVSTLGLALVVAWLLAASFSLSRIAAWIPRGVLAVVLVLLLIQLGLEVRGRMRTARPAPSASPTAAAVSAPAGPVTPLVAILWLGGALLSVLLFGTTVGSTLFTFVFLRGHAGDGWPTSAAFALVLGVGLELVFAEILQAQLYPGWLWQFAR